MRRPAILVTLALLALIGAVGLAQRPGAGEAARTARPGSAAFAVSGAEPAALVDFDNDLIPVFTSAGCNSGACHGSAAGRGGFKLSLYGGDPLADYDAIVRQLSGRRVNLVQPDQSLLLLKPTAAISHGGRQALPPDSEGAGLLREWIAQGAPYVTHRQLARVEVTPARHFAETPGAAVSLRATAHYDDGTTRDVTRWTMFTPEDSSAVTIDRQTATAEMQRRGRHNVSARYLDQVVPIQLIVPLRDAAVDLSAEVRRNFIDDEILRTLADLRLPVSPPAGDAAFLRRVTLDLTGRLPQSKRVETWLAGGGDLGREALVDELLASDAFTEFWTLKLATLLRIRSQQDKAVLTITPEAARVYHEWLAGRIRERVGYDDLVRELILAEGDSRVFGPATFYRTTEDPMAQTEFVSELFMGARIRCANCHNHPLDRWTQDDYHGLTAIFATVGREPVVRANPVGRTIHPVTGEPARLRLPGAPTPLDPALDARAAFADWLTDPENPYFAKAIVNRLWKAMMGRGLVEPVDDFRATNPASHPALLTRLADDFVEHGYDLRHTLKRIAVSAAYARGAETTAENAADDRYYSHALRRPLEPEVLADAISDVIGVPGRYGSEPIGTRAVALYDASIVSDALDILGRCGRQASCESGPPAVGALPRKLHLFNGELLNERLAAPGSRLGALLAAGEPPLDIVQAFYVAALGRHPTAGEQQFWRRQLAGGASRVVLEDFVWGLLSGSEFQTNH